MKKCALIRKVHLTTRVYGIRSSMVPQISDLVPDRGRCRIAHVPTQLHAIDLIIVMSPLFPSAINEHCTNKVLLLSYSLTCLTIKLNSCNSRTVKCNVFHSTSTSTRLPTL